MGVGMENPSRYSLFLSSPSSYGVVAGSSPNLVERGAAFLLIRYLYEQADDGDAFLAAIEQTSLTGVENLVNAFGGDSDMPTFASMMARWSLALAMTDRGITTDARYVYQARTTNPNTGNWEGVCIDCDADDNRGTQLTGVSLTNYYGYDTASLDSTALKYYDVSTIPNKMTLKGSVDDDDFGVLIRVQ